MKTPINSGRQLGLAIALILTIFLARAANAYAPYPGKSFFAPLDSWSFRDTNNWTDDNGDYPISYTNLSWSDLGDGSSLVVDTNVPAWLNYEIDQTNADATNIIVNGPGSITFWYGPGWSTVNGGPGDWAQLIDVGQWTSNSSVGYFGLSIDPPGSNLWFLAQDGEGNSYGLSAPISWTTNFFHFVTLTYCSTNVSIYVDGLLMTNDPGGLSVWPGTNVIPDGVYFGSDMFGNYQANGMFDSVQTYDYPLESNDVSQIYNDGISQFEINVYNISFMAALNSAGSSPSSNLGITNAITGPGFLTNALWDANCSYSTNAYYVWITNFVATQVGNGNMNVTFSINGGTNGWYYDVFAASQILAPFSNTQWAWMGQGLAHYKYSIYNVTGTNLAIFVLGTPYDSHNADLTDAYQLLVSKTNPGIQDSDLDGLITGWEILLGLNPFISNIGSPSQQINYKYSSADWVTNVSGVKGNSGISMDNEGNVTQVSQ
jgi:hypothetical protein